MYGYIRPLKGELKVRQLADYRAVYCGLCRSLGRRYGFGARFLINYELTFLYCLLTACGPAPAKGRAFCPANPFRRKICIQPDDEMDYTADVCVLLGCSRLDDAARDERGFRRLAAWLARLLLKKSRRRAQSRRPQLAQSIEAHLHRLHALEQQRFAGLDEPADEFAAMLAQCSACLTDDALRRPAEQILYHLGRFIYLCDAWDDLADDRKTGSYNPILCKYALQAREPTPRQRQELHTTLTHSIRLAAAALELLPLQWSRELLENIIYLGLPAVLSAVADGTFGRKDRSLQ